MPAKLVFANFAFSKDIQCNFLVKQQCKLPRIFYWITK